MPLKSFSLKGSGKLSIMLTGFTLTATSSSGLNQHKLIKCWNKEKKINKITKIIQMFKKLNF